MNIKRWVKRWKTVIGIVVFVVGVGFVGISWLGEQESVAYAHLSGAWYSKDRVTLVRTLNELEKKAQDNFSAMVSSDSIRALVVPHAGYEYSGQIAAAAYRLVKKNGKYDDSKKIKRIMVLAPAHTRFFTGVALPSFSSYKIPLGLLPIDTITVRELKRNHLFVVNNAVYAQEHSFEIQLPFIGTYFSDQVPILPLIVGDLTYEQIQKVADILATYIDSSTVVIVSSDFTHYGDRFKYTPFIDNQRLRVQQLDSGALRYMQVGDARGFLSYIKKTDVTICGAMPIVLLLALLERKVFGEVEPRLLAYATSHDKKNGVKNSSFDGNVAFDYESVSYASLVFTTEKRDMLALHDRYTQYEKSSLLAFSRAILENFFKKNISQELLYPIASSLSWAHNGAFVTLYKKGQLRGCIGRIISDEPLYKTVAAMTKAAAFDDSRFSPVAIDELSDIAIALSVLTSPKPTDSYNNIILGTHGIILKNGSKEAVFLPKVATELGWDLPTTLKALSEKAGLPGDAWKSKDTSYQVFESIDFSE